MSGHIFSDFPCLFLLQSITQHPRRRQSRHPRGQQSSPSCQATAKKQPKASTMSGVERRSLFPRPPESSRHAPLRQRTPCQRPPPPPPDQARSQRKSRHLSRREANSPSSCVPLCHLLRARADVGGRRRREANSPSCSAPSRHRLRLRCWRREACRSKLTFQQRIPSQAPPPSPPGRA